MPAYRRGDIVTENQISSYHCISRCVRRAFLCGQDRVSGKCFNYRKVWIIERLTHLISVFAIELGHYAIMDNHYHLQATIRPDLVAGWSDEEVVERWWQLYPKNGVEAIPAELRRTWLADSQFLAIRRQRLSSLSWFMKCLNEPIARRANREDRVTGSFWQGRFISKRILDKQAALETGIYIDLNPIKAGVASNIQESANTSVEERMLAILNNGPLKLLIPIKAVLRQFAEEAPYLLEDEKDYVEIVRLRAEALAKVDSRAVAMNRLIANCSTAIGSAAALEEEASRRNKKWLVGIREARRLFG